MRHFTRGDLVFVTFAGKTTKAMVALASENGRSLMLIFDGVLGGYVGVMPVMRDEDGEFLDLMGTTDGNGHRAPLAITLIGDFQ